MSFKKYIIFTLNRANTIGVIIIFFTIISFAGSYFYYFDIFNSFRFQYFLYLFPLGMFNAYFKNKFFMCLMLFFSLVNLFIIAPHMVPTNIESSHNIKVLYSNVLTSNTHHQKLIDLININNPDIIGLVEVDQKWAKSLEPLKKAYPFYKIIPQDNSFGLALYSKFEFKNLEVTRSSVGIKSIYSKLKINNKELNIYLTHPLPPTSKNYWNNRNEQYLNNYQFLLDKQGSTFLFGDFNSVPWTTRLQKTIDQLKLKSITSFRDTWPTSFPPLFRISLDHAYISKDLQGSKTVLNKIGADHLPVLYYLKN